MNAPNKSFPEQKWMIISKDAQQAGKTSRALQGLPRTSLTTLMAKKLGMRAMYD